MSAKDDSTIRFPQQRQVVASDRRSTQKHRSELKACLSPVDVGVVYAELAAEELRRGRDLETALRMVKRCEECVLRALEREGVPA